MKKIHALLLVFTGSAFLSACNSDDDELTADTAVENKALVWQSCSEQPLLQCTTLDVHADPADTDSNTISLALNRLPSIQNEREGIVLINPGGPGGSGIELLEDLFGAGVLPQALRERFDFIGFDPRGVGSSKAVDCSAFGSTEINLYLDSKLAIDQYMEDLSAVASSCEQKYGVYLQQLGSLNVVHDMDAIRQATGEDKMHFIGYSYGTRLGALYLQTYPENSGHFILDGSVKSVPDVELLVAGNLEAMQESLVAMLAECSSINSNCNANVLLEKLEENITTLAIDGHHEDLEVLARIVHFAAEDPTVSPLLLPALYEYLQTDDITELREIYQNGVSDYLADDGDDTAERAVMCADDAVRPTASYMKSLLTDYNQQSDFFAEILLSQAGMCSGWPLALNALPPITASQAPPALVIGGTTDTLTLARWSEEMAQSIGGYYLESNHLGHTSVFSGQNTCVDFIAEEFLLTGLQPLETRCLAE